MNRYTIYCTTEQTKKALELGAPISYNPFGELSNYPFIEVDNDKEIDYYDIPTAEQMIGWLEEQKRAEIDAINTQVNEDTYELAYQDAIDKCWKFLAEQCVGDDTFVFTERDFIQAMKGE